jgi:L-xylulokinase
MPEYLLGIDNGGTVSKAALFTAHGREVAVASRKVQVLEPKPGWSERDMDGIWRATAAAIREVLAKSKVNPEAIACVAPTGHGNGLYLVDKAGRAVRNAIYSTDQRAQSYIDRWLAKGVDRKVLPLTAQGLWVAQPNAILAWLRDHEPGVLKRAAHVLMCKDFVRLRLTGEVRAEITDMSGTSLLNVVTGKYDDKVLDLFGISEMRRLLPPLVKTADICGQVTARAARETGLTAGTPVAGGMFDIDACALASGLVDEKLMSLVAGTWGNNTYVARKPLIDKDLFMTSCFSIPGHYLMLEGSPTSASNLEWFVKEWLGPGGRKTRSPYELCNELVASVPAEEGGVLFLPFLYGSNVGPGAKACLIGLQARHTKAHVMRAVYEGIVFGHYTHYQRLLKFRRAPRSIRFTGGAARSDIWVQTFADCFQIPMEIPDGTELGALGAAIGASVAVGIHQDYRSAVRAMARVARRYEPDRRKKSLYAERYGQYRAAVKSLDRFWA